jgi:WD40 repeat protein
MTGFVTSVAFDPVGKRVLAASIDGRVGVWDAATGALAGRWECHRGPVNYGCAVEWVPSPGGVPEHLIAVATAYGRVLIVDVGSGAVRVLHAEHEDWVRQLRVTPDGRYVASSSQNGIGRVFDLQRDTLVGRADRDGRIVLAIDRRDRGGRSPRAPHPRGRDVTGTAV